MNEENVSNIIILDKKPKMSPNISSRWWGCESKNYLWFELSILDLSKLVKACWSFCQIKAAWYLVAFIMSEAIERKRNEVRDFYAVMDVEMRRAIYSNGLY